MELRYSSEIAANPADPQYFTGTVRLQPLVTSAVGPQVKVLRVQFAAGARTNWHTHSNPQLLVVLEGHCRVQQRGGPAFELSPGDAVSIAPGEEHWHGASAGGAMTHLAINIDLDTVWLEPVTDAEYAGQ